jgi:hypothetical protein
MFYWRFIRRPQQATVVGFSRDRPGETAIVLMASGVGLGREDKS